MRDCTVDGYHVSMTRLLTILLLIPSALVPVAHAQGVINGAQPNSNQTHPYLFSNIVWWDDDTLRSELKRRIPSLSDELKLNSPVEQRMRDVLAEMLKQKGIHGEVQVLEPSPDINPSRCAPGAPCTAIVFSILSPPDILIGPIDAQGLSSGSSEVIEKMNARFQGKPYAVNSFWLYKQDLTLQLHNSGYLESTVSLTPGPPTKIEAGYSVPLHFVISEGPQYHVGSIKVDGGPLLKGRDISAQFALKPGDVATDNLGGMDRKFAALRVYYERAGYADAIVNNSVSLDKSARLASYNITATPGPVYHLASLQVKGLTSDLEEQARKILPLHVGDIYDSNKINDLYRATNAPNSPFAGYGFSFNPVKNQPKGTVDLNVLFYKK
jgi:hypothetical protein